MGPTSPILDGDGGFSSFFRFLSLPFKAGSSRLLELAFFTSLPEIHDPVVDFLDGGMSLMSFFNAPLIADSNRAVPYPVLSGCNHSWFRR